MVITDNANRIADNVGEPVTLILPHHLTSKEMINWTMEY